MAIKLLLDGLAREVSDILSFGAFLLVFSILISSSVRKSKTLEEKKRKGELNRKLADPTMSSSFFTYLFFFTLCVFSGHCFPSVRSEDVVVVPEIRLPSDSLCTGSAADPPPPPSCPVNCFRTDPVCGVDGVTYWCGCADALCAGTHVAKLGFCEVGINGGNGPVSGQALLLVHIVWLIVLGFSVLFGLF